MKNIDDIKVEVSISDECSKRYTVACLKQLAAREARKNSEQHLLRFNADYARRVRSDYQKAAEKYATS